MSKPYARIVPGSRAEFDLVFQTNGLPVNFAPFTSGNLVFLNTAGVRTSIALSIPGSNPGSGVIRAVLSAAQTANADGKWVSADVELVRDADTTIIPLVNRFEIAKRIAPVT